jgi:hypothetical protein
MISSTLTNVVSKKLGASFRARIIDNPEFPEKHLRKWLKDRKLWNHDDWLSLLDELRGKGYRELTDSEDGRTRIGQFIEAERE